MRLLRCCYRILTWLGRWIWRLDRFNPSSHQFIALSFHLSHRRLLSVPRLWFLRRWLENSYLYAMTIPLQALHYHPLECRTVRTLAQFTRDLLHFFIIFFMFWIYEFLCYKSPKYTVIRNGNQKNNSFNNPKL